MRQANYQRVHFAAPRDLDLQEVSLLYERTLPWIGPLLEEIQGLRQALISEMEAREEITDDDPLRDRLDYLEGVLNKVGARYAAEEDWLADQNRINPYVGGITVPAGS